MEDRSHRAEKPFRWRSALIVGVVIALTIRTFLCFYGFDRRPLVTGPDEAVLQDAALSWARGTGYRLASLEGLGLAETFAHHPPLYLMAQAAVYQLTGFSVEAMRLPGIICGIVALLLFAGMLARWFHGGVISGPAVAIAGALILADPLILVVSRVARMEPMGMMFGMAAMFCVAGRRTLVVEDFKRWIAGALFIGLALATHFSTATYFVAFLGASLAVVPRFSVPKLLSLAALPVLVLASIWFCTYGGKSLEAVHELIRTADSVTAGSRPHEGAPPTLGFEYVWRAVTARDFDSVKRVGGTAYAVLWICWLTVLAAAVAARRRYREPGGKLLLVLAGVTVIQIAIAWKLSLYMVRVALYAPLAALALALAWGNLPRWARRTGAGLAAIFVAFQLALVTGYYLRLARGWDAWSPSRFDSLVASIPPDARVVSSFELWHTFMAAGRPVRITDFSLRPDQLYWEANPGALATYDVAILNPQTRDLAERASVFSAAEWSETSFVDDGLKFWVMRRR
jgi:4-amino-4-deoxy-L-arabinose transferase-like glycosyltransferase